MQIDPAVDRSKREDYQVVAADCILRLVKMSAGKRDNYNHILEAAYRFVDTYHAADADLAPETDALDYLNRERQRVDAHRAIRTVTALADINERTQGDIIYVCSLAQTLNDISQATVYSRLQATGIETKRRTRRDEQKISSAIPV
jgi:hypothetical protein